MEDLIKALQILLKYGNPRNPTNCEHDEMIIMIDPNIVSDEDLASLNALGVSPCGGGGDYFTSYRYGSA